MKKATTKSSLMRKVSLLNMLESVLRLERGAERLLFWLKDSLPFSIQPIEPASSTRYAQEHLMIIFIPQ